MGLVALALALVTPTNGLLKQDHGLALVHPIFRHHDESLEDDDDAQTAVATATTSGIAALAPAGPVGPSLGLASQGIAAHASLALLGLVLTRRQFARRRDLAHQAWPGVPTTPPR